MSPKAKLNPALKPWLKSPRLREVPRSVWAEFMSPQTVPVVAVWVSAKVMVQVYEERHGAVRLTVNRTGGAKVDAQGPSWLDGLTWEDLQSIKRAVGFGDAWAVEVYPPDRHEVNVANMRHLWVLPEGPPYAWRKSEGPPHE